MTAQVVVPVSEIERAIQVLRTAAHPYPSPHADALASLIATPHPSPTWTTTRPGEAGAYWVRGDSIGTVLVHVAMSCGELCSNLHNRNSDHEEKVTPLKYHSAKLEWLGPLHPAAAGEAVATTRHDAGFPAGPLFDPNEWDRLRNLPKGTNLYTTPQPVPAASDYPECSGDKVVDALFQFIAAICEELNVTTDNGPMEAIAAIRSLRDGRAWTVAHVAADKPPPTPEVRERVEAFSTQAWREAIAHFLRNADEHVLHSIESEAKRRALTTGAGEGRR